MKDEECMLRDCLRGGKGGDGLSVSFLLVRGRYANAGQYNHISTLYKGHNCYTYVLLIKVAK